MTAGTERVRMTSVLTNGVVVANLVAHGILIAGAVWSIACPHRRVYPMTHKTAWYYAMWGLFDYVFVSNLAFVVLDWNTGAWASPLRFALAGPLFLTGGGLLVWGIATLGVKNTSGLRDGFVARGPYLMTRNPQYVGDILLFGGVVIAANSGLVLVTHALTAFVFVLAPFAEERWLEEQYGDAYDAYRSTVPRFL